MVISHALQAPTPGQTQSVSMSWQRKGRGAAKGGDGRQTEFSVGTLPPKFTGAGDLEDVLCFCTRTAPRPALSQLDFMGGCGRGRMCVCFTPVRKAILLRSSASLSTVLFPGKLFCVNLFWVLTVFQCFPAVSTLCYTIPCAPMITPLFIFIVSLNSISQFRNVGTFICIVIFIR